MDIIEQFINREKAKLNWFEKLFRYPKFYFTKEVEISKEDYEKLKSNYSTKPSLLTRILASIFILFGLYGWFLFLLLTILNELFPVSLFLLIFASLWIAFIFRYFIFPPKLIMDYEGIYTKKFSLIWETISEAAIMIKGSGRRKTSTLVLFTKDNKIYKFKLYNLGNSCEEIIKLLELYRKKRTHNIG